MKTNDFHYDLPARLIAQTPIEPRDSSRLLVLHRSSGSPEHRVFRDLAGYLDRGDVLVLNDTRVIPARLLGTREDTGGRVELLLLNRLGPGMWRALGKPGRRLKPGTRVRIPADREQELSIEVLEAEPGGVKTVRLSSEELLERAGHTPLPPYIRTPLDSPDRYQTVYARETGSVAAPTAGLHFTRRVLAELESRGVTLVFVTLHVGLDTFRPVRTEDPTQHQLHGEYFELGADGARRLEEARALGRRIVAVGTTSVRVLEQVALGLDGRAPYGLAAAAGWATLYILPGHRFQLVDAMLTNFHLPRTTLLMLVSAFAGRERVLSAYEEAIAKEYRFYSFGDAMLILP